MNGSLKYTKEMKHMPNQKWHKVLSFIKSGIRIYGFALMPISIVWSMIVLITAEIIGILEEMV